MESTTIHFIHKKKADRSENGNKHNSYEGGVSSKSSCGTNEVYISDLTINALYRNIQTLRSVAQVECFRNNNRALFRIILRERPIEYRNMLKTIRNWRQLLRSGNSQMIESVRNQSIEEFRRWRL